MGGVLVDNLVAIPHRYAEGLEHYTVCGIQQLLIGFPFRPSIMSERSKDIVISPVFQGTDRASLSPATSDNVDHLLGLVPCPGAIDHSWRPHQQQSGSVFNGIHVLPDLGR
jgi:hypothetical protein